MRRPWVVGMAAVIGVSAAGCRPRAAGTATAAPPDYTRFENDYAWPREAASYEPLVARFPPPEGFTRVPVAELSWGEWLRHLPMLPEGTPVVTETGGLIGGPESGWLAGVIDMDIRENQECTDVIHRLRAEYLRWAGRDEEIVFRLTGSGDSVVSWPKWKQGYRPSWDGRRLRFHQTGQPGRSRKSFDAFLATVFAWCGTDSMSLDGHRPQPDDVRIGDFFIHPGDPGHAVLIADLAVDRQGARKALILQGYLPAQSPHLLARSGEPWFDLDTTKPFDSPRWGEFKWSELRRF
jgi:hypothetical protein